LANPAIPADGSSLGGTAATPVAGANRVTTSASVAARQEPRPSVEDRFALPLTPTA